MADHEPMTDVACGEPELSAELRDALALLRDRSEDDEFRTLVGEVLAGRTSLLDASGTTAFSKMVFARIAQEAQSYRPEAHCAETHCAADGAELGHCGPCGGCAGSCAISGAGPPS
ncbi:MAG: hypothetical protein ACRDTF_18970 [Pseudonocardiaceae bacterium]